MLSEAISTMGGEEGRFPDREGLSVQHADRKSEGDLPDARRSRRISECMDQGKVRIAPVPAARLGQDSHRGGLGVPDLQHQTVDTAALDGNNMRSGLNLEA